MLSRSLLRAARTRSSTARIIPARSPLSSLAAPSRSPVQTPWISALPQVRSRWYSDVAEKPASDAAKSEETAASSNSEVEALKKELEAKNKEVVDLKDKYLRSVADYRNLQDRTKREAQAARDFALQKFVKDLLSSIDNLEHALLSIPEAKLSSPPAPGSEGATIEALHTDLVNLHKGLQLTETALLDTLKRHGVTRYDPAKENDKFDPNIHDAVFMAPMQGKDDNTVFHTQQKGFMLNGRVVRAAQVGVVKNS